MILQKSSLAQQYVYLLNLLKVPFPFIRKPHCRLYCSCKLLANYLIMRKSNKNDSSVSIYEYAFVVLFTLISFFIKWHIYVVTDFANRLFTGTN